MSKGQYLVLPREPPPLDIPHSTSTVTVRIIDSTSELTAPLSLLLGPAIPGHEILRIPALCFLIEHPSGRKLLYDLGTKKAVHPRKQANQPFYASKPGFAYDQQAVEETLKKMTAFDAADNIWVIIAHDSSLREQHFPMFPARANDWKRGNWAEKVRWSFTKDFMEAISSELSRGSGGR